MSKRVFIPGLSVFGALAMISSISATAMAQQVPVRVIQGSDGTMYVVQGGNSWTLVPDQASDSDVAALNPGGEIDGTLPNSLFVVQAPAAPPAAAAPAPPAPPVQVRVDVNKELTLVPNANVTCNGDANASKLIASLASVERQADGRTVWHVGLLNHASAPFTFRGAPDVDPSYRALAYVVAGDGTKFDAFALENGTVAVEERKALDVILQQTNIPAGAYRVFLVIPQVIFDTAPFSLSTCRGLAWSSTPISLP